MLFISRNISAIAVGLITVYGNNGILCDGIAFGGNDLELHSVRSAILKGIGGSQLCVGGLVNVKINQLCRVFGGIGRGDLNGCKIAGLGSCYSKNNFFKHVCNHCFNSYGLIIQIEVRGVLVVRRIDRYVAGFYDPSQKDLSFGNLVCLEIDVLAQALGNFHGTGAIFIRLTVDYGDRNRKFKVVEPQRETSARLFTVDVYLGVAIDLITVCKNELELQAIRVTKHIRILSAKLCIRRLVQRNADVLTSVFCRILGNELKRGMCAYCRRRDRKFQFIQYHDLGIYSLKLYVACGHREDGVV